VTARAAVESDFAHDGVSIWLGTKFSDGQIGTALELPALTIVRREPGVVPAGSPTLRLTDDMAGALLAALAKHYGGAGDVLTVRRDYERERARVDKLMAWLADSNAALSRALYDHLPKG
jgi:hypothetical protein